MARSQIDEFTLNGNERFELVNFVDGERSVTEIRVALSAEFRPVSLEVVARSLDDLAQVGVLSWERWLAEVSGRWANKSLTCRSSDW